MTARFTHLKGHAVVVCTLAVAGLAASVMSATAQDFMERSHKQQGPQPEVKPKVDEKAYKAALEKIPAPKQKYDPWGVARPSDDANTGKKPH
jgi:hypothetical protein